MSVLFTSKSFFQLEECLAVLGIIVLTKDLTKDKISVKQPYLWYFLMATLVNLCKVEIYIGVRPGGNLVFYFEIDGKLLDNNEEKTEKTEFAFKYLIMNIEEI